MTNSILNSTKKILNIPADYTVFDLDVMTHINTSFMTLQQLGVGPAGGFMIEDDTAEWGDLLGGDLRLNAVKTYIYLKVRLAFDPPTTSFAIASMQEQVRELEWRINVVVDTKPPTTTVDGVEMWVMSPSDPLSDQVQIGDLAYDPNTGDVWRIQ